MPTDVSTDSQVAAAEDERLARLFDARLALLHVVDYLPQRYGIRITGPEHSPGAGRRRGRGLPAHAASERNAWSMYGHARMKH